MPDRRLGGRQLTADRVPGVFEPNPHSHVSDIIEARERHPESNLTAGEQLPCSKLSGAPRSPKRAFPVACK
jgi:hypothetical protein